MSTGTYTITRKHADKSEENEWTVDSLEELHRTVGQFVLIYLLLGTIETRSGLIEAYDEYGVFTTSIRWSLN